MYEIPMYNVLVCDWWHSNAALRDRDAWSSMEICCTLWVFLRHIDLPTGEDVQSAAVQWVAASPVQPPSTKLPSQTPPRTERK